MTLTSGSGGVNYNTFTNGGMGSGMGYPEGEEENNEEEEKPWYLDHDNDGYHSEIRISKDKPLGGNWISTTNGEDCDDTESSLTTDCSCETKCLLVKSDKTGKSKSTKRTAKDIDVSDCECEEDDDEEEDFRVFNELTGKALCVYERLERISGGFRNAIKKFDGDFPVSHLRFEINNNLPSGNYGITIPPLNTENTPNNYNIEIQMSNENLSQISDLGSALSIVHEAIHAETFRLMMAAAKKGHLNTDEFSRDEIIFYINNLREHSEGIFDYYYERRERFGVPDAWNHEQMATHYRGVIADILEEYDNFKLDRQIYDDLAWAGLRYNEDYNGSKVMTIAWAELTEDEKNRVKENLNNYFFNGNNTCD